MCISNKLPVGTHCLNGKAPVFLQESQPQCFQRASRVLPKENLLAAKECRPHRGRSIPQLGFTHVQTLPHGYGGGGGVFLKGDQTKGERLSELY